MNGLHVENMTQMTQLFPISAKRFWFATMDAVEPETSQVCSLLDNSLGVGNSISKHTNFQKIYHPIHLQSAYFRFALQP